ncbi:MAG TPA: DUF4097 family beta strand repeat-containing protein [Opitutaceae bacterium]|jgi:hypothetical protein
MTPYRIAAYACGFALIAASASARIERNVEKTFQVQPGVTVKITTSGGDIKVIPSSETTVKIVATEHVRAGSEAEADDVLKNLDLDFSQSGNEVSAVAQYHGDSGWHWGGTPVVVDFTVSVPPGASANLKTSGGSITVGDIQGSLRARTSGGNLRIGSIGGEVDAETSGGNVDLAQGGGKTRLSTSGGNITADRIVGPAELRTSGGNIKVDAVDNTLDASTSGGDVRAEFDGALKGDCVLKTSGGQVRATVDKAAAFHLEASTSGGEVDASGLTITIDHGGPGKSSLSGSVNGGGPLLRLASSGGDIKVSTH